MVDTGRGRRDTVGEGRRTNSRSSSRSSTASQKTRRSPSLDSDNESTTPSSMPQNDERDAASASLVRPAMGFKWGESQPVKVSGSSPSFYAQPTASQTYANALNGASRTQRNSSTPLSTTPALYALPSKVRLSSSSNSFADGTTKRGHSTPENASATPSIQTEAPSLATQAGDNRAAENVSQDKHQETSASAAVPAMEPETLPSNLSFHSDDHLVPQAGLDGSGVRKETPPRLSTSAWGDVAARNNPAGSDSIEAGNDTTTPVHPQSSLDSHRKAEYSERQRRVTATPSPEPSLTTMIDVRKNSPVQARTPPDTASAVSVPLQPSHSLQNSNPLMSITENRASSVETHASIQVPTIDAQDNPHSFHNFLSPANPAQYAVSASPQSSTLASATPGTDASTAVLPPAHQRKVCNPTPIPAKGQEVILAAESEDVGTSQSRALGGKKGGRTPKSQSRKKRGEWRVENYNTTRASASPINNQPQHYYSGPHQPAFKTSAPGTAEATMTTTAASSHWQVTQSVMSSQSSHEKDRPNVPGLSSHVQNTSQGQYSIDHLTSQGMTNLDDTGNRSSITIETPTSEHNIDDQLTSEVSLDVNRHAPSPNTQHSQQVEKSAFSPPLIKETDSGAAASLTGHASPRYLATTDVAAVHTPLSAFDAPHPMPEIRLMTILIEDTRMECDEPSLVEVRIPLQPAKDGSFWADAVDVCKHLQTGPSRIDGPAKVYCFRGHGPRGRFRQYFLRISAENIDNFVSANLYVTAKRILRVVVEELASLPVRPVTSPLTSFPTHSPAPSTHLVSPVLSEQFQPSTSNVYSSHSSHPLKRGRDETSLHMDTNDAIVDNSITEISTKRKKTNSPDMSNSRHYR